MMANRLLILDRDGVINEDSDAYIKSIDEWKPLPGSVEAIARLSHAGYRIAIATNQSGVGRGLFSLSDLHAMHRLLRDLVAAQGGRIEMIAFCPHTPEDQCRCRKPEVGLLEEIAKRLHTNLTDVPFIGDSLNDIRAARAVGATPLLVKTGKGERTLASLRQQRQGRLLDNVPIYRDLSAVANAILHSQG